MKLYWIRKKIILLPFLHETAICLVQWGWNALKPRLPNNCYLRELECKIYKYIRHCILASKQQRTCTCCARFGFSLSIKLNQQTLNLFFCYFKTTKTDMFGNPLRQKGDKRAPFNSNKMTKFAKKMERLNISKSLWETWSQKGVEIVMKPVGNAMKIGNIEKTSKYETHSAFTAPYRNTPQIINWNSISPDDFSWWL